MTGLPAIWLHFFWQGIFRRKRNQPPGLPVVPDATENYVQEIDVFNLPLALAISVGAVSVFSFIAVAVWTDNRRKEREAFYKSEVVKKMLESQAPGGSAVEFLREDEKIAARRLREGVKLGGLITTAVGIGLMIFLKAVDPGHQTFLVGAIPLLVGVALLLYSYLIAPQG
jgi:hypothetical protein